MTVSLLHIYEFYIILFVLQVIDINEKLTIVIISFEWSKVENIGVLFLYVMKPNLSWRTSHNVFKYNLVI